MPSMTSSRSASPTDFNSTVRNGGVNICARAFAASENMSPEVMGVLGASKCRRREGGDHCRPESDTDNASSLALWLWIPALASLGRNDPCRGSRPGNRAPAPSNRKQRRQCCIPRLDRGRSLFLERYWQIGPVELLVFEAVLDRRFHHREIGRDVEVARRVKRVMADFEQLAPRGAAFGLRDS